VEKNLIARLLKDFAKDQRSALVDYNKFLFYMEDYVKQHIAEDPSLVIYWKNSAENLQIELEKLEKEKAALVLTDKLEKQIIVIAYLLSIVTSLYKRLENNPNLPFPDIKALPNYVPATAFESCSASNFIYDFLENQNIVQNAVYILELNPAIPQVIFSSALPGEALLNPALFKLKIMLEQEKFYSFFLKRIGQTDVVKQKQIQVFFDRVLDDPVAEFALIREKAGAYSNWTQLCYNVRQNYETVAELTSGDISQFQAMFIIEIFAVYYKDKTEKRQQKDSAWQTLKVLLNKPPYFFSYDTIKKFTNQNDVPLISQYSENELKFFLQQATKRRGTAMPTLLTFTFKQDLRPDVQYYVIKQNLLQLMNHLRNDASKTIKTILMKECVQALKNFESIPFTSRKIFEDKINEEIKKNTPVFHTLLHADFFIPVYNEALEKKGEAVSNLNFVSSDLLLPLSAILSLSRDELIYDAKGKVPIWYRFPPVAFFIWISTEIEKKVGIRPKRNPQYLTVLQDMAELEDSSPQAEWKRNLKNSLAQIKESLIQPGSTMMRELTLYEEQWNKLKNLKAHDKLTADVNTEIHDYVQRSLRSIRMTNLDYNRLQKMADAIVNIPAMGQIKDREQLSIYVQLQIVSLLDNV
jgi:hypothetical protein